VALARPTRGINHVLAYGQSLSTGWEGWPALSVRPRHDSLMLGGSVRPASEHAPDFVPVGGPVFSRLRATVQHHQTGALLDAATVAALPPGDAALGETVLEAAVNFWRGRMLAEGAARGVNLLLASACGVGGRPIERLARGAEPELFNRLRACVRLAHAAAEGAGRSYGLTALLLLQGEHNSWAIDGGTDDRATYKSLLQQLHRDMAALAGDDPPPALFLYQTGGAYASDSMSIPMAQLETALEVPGVFLAAPVYPVTDKGGHLDANGYRWLGAQFGKVMHHVLTRNLPWHPLHPTGATLDGRVVTLRFHVPVPPLRFGQPMSGLRRLDVPEQGFAVLDGAGEVPVEQVALSGPESVAITLARPPGPGAMVRYAGRTRHGGRGGLHDSDPTLAEDRYEFDPTTGHYPEADVPGLTGEFYPLMNWCVGFSIGLGEAAAA
jgi:hypothetical protein